MSRRKVPAAKVFLSYAHEDAELRRALGTHLAPLERQKVIATWHDRKIPPGGQWAGEIDRELEEADVVLLLVSPDFVASDYCYEIEMERATSRRTHSWGFENFEVLAGFPYPHGVVANHPSRTECPPERGFCRSTSPF